MDVPSLRTFKWKLYVKVLSLRVAIGRYISFRGNEKSQGKRTKAWLKEATESLPNTRVEQYFQLSFERSDDRYNRKSYRWKFSYIICMNHQNHTV